jgi:putative FmdB family regulatory protein
MRPGGGLSPPARAGMLEGRQQRTAMPTYDYECGRCGQRFEKSQPMSARPVRKCPQCGGRVRRLIGTGAAALVRGGRKSAGDEPPPCARGAPCAGPDGTCPAFRDRR